MFRLPGSLPQDLLQLRCTLERHRACLTEVLHADLDALAAGIYPTETWSIDSHVVSVLSHLLGGAPEAEAEIARLRFLARSEMHRLCLCLPGYATTHRGFVVEHLELVGLHHLMYAVESELSRRHVLFGANYARQIARLCDLLDVRREDLEDHVCDGVVAKRRGHGDRSSAADTLRTALLVFPDIDLSTRERMLAAASRAMQRALDRWSISAPAIPALLLASHVFLLARHAALSAWEDCAA
jgi:hypothetical protein